MNLEGRQRSLRFVVNEDVNKAGANIDAKVDGRERLNVRGSVSSFRVWGS